MGQCQHAAVGTLHDGSVDRGALESDTERADAVIPKPFRLEELTSTIKDLAGRRREIDSSG